MKKSTISNYCKLATVLLVDAIPVWFTISLRINGSDTDFIGFWLLLIYFFFLAFTIWAVGVYYLTKRIERLWLRDILFYFSLLVFLCIPLYYVVR